jgi:cytoskeleton protein RodZ
MPRKTIKKTAQQNEHPVPQEEENIPQEEENIPQEEESLQLLCQKIREARISKELSLESISGHLHISVRILKAIEDGNPKNGPTPVFFRGMARTYCQFLELDKTGIVEKIDNLLKVEDLDDKINTRNITKGHVRWRPNQFARSDSHPIRNAITILIILLAGYLFYSLYFVQESFFLAEDNATNPQQSVVEEEVATEPEQSVVAKIQETAVAADSTQEVANDKPEVQEESTEVATVDEKQVETAKSIEQVIIQTPVEPLTLEVEASEGTWVSISVDGNDIEDYRIEADEIQQWEAKENYLLTLGNTRVVRVLLNGREIETNRTNQLLTDWVVDANLLP